MNIKLDHDVRIRISQNEYQQILQTRSLMQKFQLGGVFQFEVLLTLNSVTRVTETNHLIAIELSEEDYNSLMKNQNKKRGLQVSNYTLQVDLLKEKNKLS